MTDVRELLRYEEPLGSGQLADVLTGRVTPPTTSTGVMKEIDNLATEAESIYGGSGSGSGTELDALFAPVLHRELKGTPTRILTDSGLWHWLATQPLSVFVKHRWLPDKDADLENVTAQQERFLGKSTLNGVNRNALARLYWTAEATVVAGDYDLTKKVLQNADLHLQIFDRELSLDSRLAKECVRSLHNVGQDLHRQAIVNIRVRLGTVVIEALDEAAITELVGDCLTIAQKQAKSK